MAPRRWRSSLGWIAVLIWSGMVGIPVVVFHATNPGMDLGEHLHAVVLFIASEFLVFWLAARQGESTRKPAPAPAPISVPTVLVSPFSDARTPAEVWQAELVEGDGGAASGAATAVSDAAPNLATPPLHRIKFVVVNYVGSSRSRVVYIEPGRSQYVLHPGQELEVTATARGVNPSVQIVESDMATQVHINGIAVEVSVTPPDAADLANDRSAATA